MHTAAAQSPLADISAICTSPGLQQLVELLSAEKAEIAEAAGRLLARLCSTRQQVSELVICQAALCYLPSELQA